MAPSVVRAASQSFVDTAAGVVAAVVESVIATRGACTVALCGGSTPEPVYRELAGRAIDWSTVSIYFGDERAVPPDHPDSNYGMARRALLAHVHMPPEQIYRMAAERPDLDAAAREYDRLLPPRLDLLLLGVGPDGHTASIFPGSPAVTESWRRVVAVAVPPSPILPQVARMTLTPLVIAAARHVIVLVRGADKAAVVQRVLEGPDLPAMLPAQYAGGGTWIVDDAAAAQLQSQDN